MLICYYLAILKKYKYLYLFLGTKLMASIWKLSFCHSWQICCIPPSQGESEFIYDLSFLPKLFLHLFPTPLVMWIIFNLQTNKTEFVLFFTSNYFIHQYGSKPYNESAFTISVGISNLYDWKFTKKKKKYMVIHITFACTKDIIPNRSVLSLKYFSLWVPFGLGPYYEENPERWNL